MKIFLKKCLFAIFMMILLAICVPHKALAGESYTNKVVSTIKPNEWVKLKGTKTSFQAYSMHATNNIYKITVPANSYVKFESKSSCIINFCDDISKNEKPEPLFHSGGNPFYRALPKGTFFIYSTDEVTIRYSVMKFIKTNNFCFSNAQKLARGKKVIFSDRDGYNRWYKIVLSKRKSITLYLVDMTLKYAFSDWAFYDANGTLIECKKEYGGVNKTPILSKGTYYLYIRYPQGCAQNIYDVDGIWNVKSFYWN